MSGRGKPLNGQSRLNPPLPRGKLAVGEMAQWDGAKWAPIVLSPNTIISGSGTGSVTSVGLTMPKEFVFPVAGSPVTTSGTLVVAWAPESINSFLAGPVSGSPGVPGFRSMSYYDLPVPIVLGGTTGLWYVYNTATTTYWSCSLNALGVLVTTDTGSGTPP